MGVKKDVFFCHFLKSYNVLYISTLAFALKDPLKRETLWTPILSADLTSSSFPLIQDST